MAVDPRERARTPGSVGDLMSSLTRKTISWRCLAVGPWRERLVGFCELVEKGLRAE